MSILPPDATPHEALQALRSVCEGTPEGFQRIELYHGKFHFFVAAHSPSNRVVAEITIKAARSSHDLIFTGIGDSLETALLDLEKDIAESEARDKAAILGAR